MKILLVAPQSRDTILGSIGIHCAKVLENLGCTIEVFDFRESQFLRSSIGFLLKKVLKKTLRSLHMRRNFTRELEKDKMNHRLIEVAIEYKPDIMLVLLGDTISCETISEIRKRGIVMANWFHDTVLAPVRKDFVRNVSPYYDYFFTVDSKEVLRYNKISSRCVRTIPLACDPETHKEIALSEMEKNKYGNKVSFVGTLKFEREKLLTRLVEFDLGIWGHWKKKNRTLKNFYRGQHIFGKEAVKVYNASDIVLDINEGNEHRDFYVTPRVFEAPASGAFLLTSNDAYLSELYEIGKEIICYSNENDLKELIRYYLDHPIERNEIAKKGQQRAYRDHTYEERLKQILSIIENYG